MKHTIYLAGGCYWGVQKYLDQLPGVLATEVGFANGYAVSPTYAEVCAGDTGHTETVQVVFDDEVISLKTLLRLFYRIIDPTTVNRQGHDVGYQYRTGVFYTEPEDLPVIEVSLQKLAKAYERPLVVAVEPLTSFYPAETSHQKYLDKTPGGYCHVPIEQILWAQTVDLAAFETEE